MLENLPLQSIKHKALTIEGYSRAAVQSYWRVPELKLGFELGGSPWAFMGTSTFFVSHAHLDHLAAMPVSASLLPGLYAADDRRIARNVIGAETTLAPAAWPLGVPVAGLVTITPTDLMAAFLIAALVLLLIDALAAMWLAGRLTGLARGAAIVILATV